MYVCMYVLLPVGTAMWLVSLWIRGADTCLCVVFIISTTSKPRNDDQRVGMDWGLVIKGLQCCGEFVLTLMLKPCSYDSCKPCTLECVYNHSKMVHMHVAVRLYS